MASSDDLYSAAVLPQTPAPTPSQGGSSTGSRPDHRPPNPTGKAKPPKNSAIAASSHQSFSNGSPAVAANVSTKPSVAANYACADGNDSTLESAKRGGTRSKQSNPTSRSSPTVRDSPPVGPQSSDHIHVHTNGDMAIPYTEEHPELVEPDPKHQCEAQRHTLYDPMQTPCGHRICEPCLDRELDGKESIPCPAGEDSCEMLTKDNVFPDYGERRELSRTDVYCIFRLFGCLEIFQLRELKNHLETCVFRPIACVYKKLGCPETLTRDTYQNHVKKCNYEPSKCPQCGLEIPKCDKQDHISNSCPKGKTRCPNNCGETNIPRDKLEEHSKACPKKPQECTYKQHGCNFKGNNNAMTQHARDEMPFHLDLLNRALQQKDSHLLDVSKEMKTANDTIKKLSSQLETSKTQLDKQKSLSANQEQKIRDLTKSLAKQGVGISNLEETSKQFAKKEELARHDHELNTLNSRIGQQEAAVGGFGNMAGGNITDAVTSKLTAQQRQIAIQQVRLAEAELRFQCLETTNYNGVLLWKIPEYEKKKHEANNGQTLSIYSQPFYTSRYGYKMCARIYINGDGQGKGTHLSFFFVVMRGDFDALLRWPFRQKVTLTLLDQSGRRHVSDTFRPDPSSSSFKKPETEMNIASGCPLFAAHSVVERPPYMQDDTIFLRVTVDTTDLEL